MLTSQNNNNNEQEEKEIIKNELNEINKEIINELILNDGHNIYNTVNTNKNNTSYISHHSNSNHNNQLNIHTELSTANQKLKKVIEEERIIIKNEEHRKEGVDLVEHNQRQSRLKEIKSMKENLERKVNIIKDNIKRIYDEEKYQENRKKYIKGYIDSYVNEKTEKTERKGIFSHSKKKEEEMEKKRIEYEKKYNQLLNEEILEKKKKTEINKDLIIQIHNEEKDILKRLKEKNEKYINLQRDAMKNTVEKEKIKKNKEKLIEKEKREREEEEKKEKLRKEENLKRKQYYKPISSIEIREFAKKFDEELERRLYEKKKKRLIHIEKIVESNMVLMKKETVFKKRVKEEEKENRNKQEKDKLERVFKMMKAQNFSKIVYEKLGKREKENFIKDEEKEGRERKLKRRNKVIKAGTVDRKKVLLFSKKYRSIKYKIKKEENLSQIKEEKEGGIREKEENREKKEEILKPGNKSNRQVLVPLKKNEKFSNYLREIKKNTSKKEGINWKNMINNKKYNKIYNIEAVKHQTNFLDEQIKQKEKYLKIVGGVDKAPEDAAKLMNYKIESMKAKLAVLDAMDSIEN